MQGQLLCALSQEAVGEIAPQMRDGSRRGLLWDPGRREPQDRSGAHRKCPDGGSEAELGAALNPGCCEERQETIPSSKRGSN
jgi:hypothetical protein